jgi:hypothetical protein
MSPYKWVAPEMFLSAEETTVCPVYHTYRDDMWNSPMQFHFTTDATEPEDHMFDVRDLPTWKASGKNKMIAIIKAMQQGLIKVPEVW